MGERSAFVNMASGSDESEDEVSLNEGGGAAWQVRIALHPHSTYQAHPCATIRR